MLEFLETKVFWITAAAVAVYLYLKYYVLTYWQRHGVPCESPWMIIGNFPVKFFFDKISLGNLVKENYEKFCENPFHGFYTFHKPAIIINDPELIKLVLVKDFQKFPDRGWFHNDKIDKLSGNLFLLPGEKWKKLRAKLTPIFSTGKLRQMHQLVVEVSNEMISACEDELKHSDVLEMKHVMGSYTVDIISSVVYGLKRSSFKNPNDEFRTHGTQSVTFGRLSLLVGLFSPDLLEKLNIPFLKDCSREFFLTLFKDMVDYRRKEKIVRQDFLNLLMQLMDNGQADGGEGKTTDGTASNFEKLTMIQAAAQAFVFFVAGYETASSTATYTLLELALNPELQDKLRKEVDQMADTKGLTYDSIMENEYLDMVFSETLRKHPSVPLLNRICVEDFEIPNSNYTIPKGMRVIIPVSGIQRNPKFYPNPDKFDPTRFTKENAAKRSNYIHLGFGEGPRFCIGKRFGQLQAKQAIVAMLRNYIFYVSEKTEMPVKYSTEAFPQSPGTGVYLRVEKRNI